MHRPRSRRGELGDEPHRAESLHRLVHRLRADAVEVKPVRDVHYVCLHEGFDVGNLSPTERPGEGHVLDDVDDTLRAEVEEGEGALGGDETLDEFDLDVGRLGADETAEHAVEHRGLELEGDLVVVVAGDLVLVEHLLAEQIGVELEPAAHDVVLREVHGVRGEQHAELLTELVEDGDETLEPVDPDAAEARAELHGGGSRRAPGGDAPRAGRERGRRAASDGREEGPR